ncbi:hypothetical protein [Azospirillum palustre]
MTVPAPAPSDAIIHRNAADYSQTSQRFKQPLRKNVRSCEALCKCRFALAKIAKNG